LDPEFRWNNTGPDVDAMLVKEDLQEIAGVCLIIDDHCPQALQIHV
jgi:hypothetical protein